AGAARPRTAPTPPATAPPTRNPAANRAISPSKAARAGPVAIADMTDPSSSPWHDALAPNVRQHATGGAGVHRTPVSVMGGLPCALRLDVVSLLPELFARLWAEPGRVAGRTARGSGRMSGHAGAAVGGGRGGPGGSGGVGCGAGGADPGGRRAALVLTQWSGRAVSVGFLGAARRRAARLALPSRARVRILPARAGLLRMAETPDR